MTLNQKLRISSISQSSWMAFCHCPAFSQPLIALLKVMILQVLRPKNTFGIIHITNPSLLVRDSVQCFTFDYGKI